MTLADVPDVSDVRDPELPGRLLRTERDLLIPLLRARPEADFALRTACPGWTVRHVLAHCGAVLTRVVERRFEKGVFEPEANDRDIAERDGLPVERIVDELERGMTEAGPVIARAGGVLDAVALGEWVHAGDVREAFGEPGARACRTPSRCFPASPGSGTTSPCTPTSTAWTSRCGSGAPRAPARRPGTSGTRPPSYGCTRAAPWWARGTNSPGRPRRS